MHKKEKYVEYKLSDGNSIVLPYILIKGEEDGPTVSVTAGVHGCEYPAIASAIALSKNLNPKKLKGTVKIIPIVDMKAFKKKSPFVCPEDRKNVNRCFPGDKDGTYSEILVYHLFNEFIKGSDYYIDLHSADLTEEMIPFCEIHESGDADINAISFDMAKYSGINKIVFKSSEGEINDKNQSYSTAAEAGIPGLVINAGKIDGDIKEYINIHLHGLMNILTYAKCLDGSLIEYNNYNCYKAPIHIRSKKVGLFYNNCKIGDEVKKGDVLGRIEDVFGRELDVLKAPATGEILLVNTSLPVKEDALLLEIIARK
ncbi:MAG: succinylglutamate desuccinylase/aspartoacylase family protein [Firmicutes bacterium]|nr:succinylglutamate desuccinylase/aspartoacylase family protein [Bacillota bacterium]